MTTNNPFRLNPAVVATLPRFLAHAEGTTGETGKTSIVRNGDSGLSVGRIQMDLSKHKDLADRLVAIGKAGGVAGAEEITADMLKQRMKRSRTETEGTTKCKSQRLRSSLRAC